MHIFMSKLQIYADGTIYRHYCMYFKDFPVDSWHYYITVLHTAIIIAYLPDSEIW